MNKFSLDYEHLDQRINTRKVYRLADVQHRIEKVAFDVVRFIDDDDSTRLWQVQDTPEGPVIVAMYEQEAAEPGISVELKSESAEWAAVPDKQAGVNVFHKGEAIVRLAAADFGIPESEIGTLCRWLPKKLATDEDLRGMILKMAEPPEAVELRPEMGMVPPTAMEPAEEVAETGAEGGYESYIDQDALDKITAVLMPLDVKARYATAIALMKSLKEGLPTEGAGVPSEEAGLPGPEIKQLEAAMTALITKLAAS